MPTSKVFGPEQRGYLPLRGVKEATESQVNNAAGHIAHEIKVSGQKSSEKLNISEYETGTSRG